MQKIPYSSRFSVYLLPAIIAQSMIMGGGYSTGREIVQYAARFGPVGWLAVLVIFLGFAVLSALAFEVARLGKAYDYKSWGKQLIGPLWPVYDLLTITMLLLVIAVMSAAIGAILRDTVGLPYNVGLLIAVIFVAVLAWKGTAFMETFKTIGSVALYIAYVAFSIVVLTTVEAPQPLAPSTASTGSVLVSALQYVGYNLATFPAVLFCLHRQTTRRETIGGGFVSGLAMTVPFALTFLCLMRFWPSDAVFSAEVPWLEMLGAASGGSQVWVVVFGIVAGWTLLETAVGGIHALVDRLEHNIEDVPEFLRPAGGNLSPLQRAAISVAILLASILLARFGIIDLVAKGYGMLSWGFILFMALPLLTVGVYRMITGPASSVAEG